MPLPDKVQAIKDIAVPNNKKQLRNFIGVINSYKDIWKHRSLPKLLLNGLPGTGSKNTRKPLNTWKIYI